METFKKNIQKYKNLGFKHDIVKHSFVKFFMSISIYTDESTIDAFNNEHYDVIIKIIKSYRYESRTELSKLDDDKQNDILVCLIYVAYSYFINDLYITSVAIKPAIESMNDNEIENTIMTMTIKLSATLLKINCNHLKK